MRKYLHWTSVTVLPIKSSMTKLVSIKSVCDGYSLVQGTSSYLFKSAKLIQPLQQGKVKDIFFWQQNSHLWWNVFITMSQNQTPRVWISVKEKFKIEPSMGKVMITVFWDAKEPIPEDFMEKKTDQQHITMKCWKTS